MRTAILVVEDERIVADDIRRTLIKQGYEVLEPVASGAEAIRVAEEHEPRLVLMDITLQGTMNGIETAATIRDRLHIPIVFLTSHSDGPTVDRAAAADSNGYLLKPFEDRELGAAVQFALRKDELERKLAEREARLRRSELLHRSLVKQLSGISVIVFDAELRVLIAEGTASSRTPRGSSLGDTAGADLRASREAQWRAALRGVESTYENEQQGIIHRVTVVPLRDDDGTIFAGMLVAQDITDHKRRAAELEALSLTDELTGVRNRRGFLALAEQHARGAQRKGEPFGILFADINGLKWINDTLGHEIGDQAIRETAMVLNQTMREADIVGRLGGDEFAVLVAGCGKNGIPPILARLERGLNDFGSGDAREYQLSLSIGAALYDPERPQSIDTLLAEADRRMYTCKEERRASSSLPVTKGTLF